MRRSYDSLDTQTSASEEELAFFLRKNGQQLLPMVDLIMQSRVAINELIDSVGRAMLEALLEVSAEQVAAARKPGTAREQDVLWYGRQPGRVYLGDRKLAVERPRRLARTRPPQVGRGAGLCCPAESRGHAEADVGHRNERRFHAPLQTCDSRDGGEPRHLEIQCEPGDDRGIRSGVKGTAGARLDDKDFLIIYMDGLHCGEHCVIGVFSVAPSWMPNTSAACRDLLQNLVESGFNPELERLFVIDGSKALRSAINAVFGGKAAVQRCRQHKLRNVVDRLPREQQAQTCSLIRAAWKVDTKEGMARLRKVAEWLREDYSDAAGSLLEGMEECFTINPLNILFAASLLGDHEPDREFAVGSADANASCLPLARYDASALGWPQPSWRRNTTSAA